MNKKSCLNIDKNCSLLYQFKAMILKKEKHVWFVREKIVFF